MLSKTEFEARLREMLEAMDEVCDQASGDAAEDLRELNAELEDAIFMLHEIAPEDMAEELPDALDEFGALAEGYAVLARAVPVLTGQAKRLAALIRAARGEIGA